MSEIIYLIFYFIVGFALGLFFFGGLWLTVKKAVTSKMPALLFVSSFIIRVGVVVLVFYFISPGGWQALLASLLGLITARFAVIYLTKKGGYRES